MGRYQRVKRSRDENSSISYYISNGQLELKDYAKYIRNHWRIESNNHVRDVTFNEDRTVKVHNPGCFARLLSIAKNLMCSLKVKNIKMELEKNAMSFNYMYKNIENL